MNDDKIWSEKDWQMLFPKKDDELFIPSTLRECDRVDIRIGTKFKMGMSVKSREKWTNSDIVEILKEAINMLESKPVVDKKIF